ALADQVDGTPDTHSRHREAVCSYIEQHPDEFVPFMDESSPFGRYVNNMRRLGVFGGNLELVAFARNYRVDIKVYQLGGKVFIISGAPADSPNDPHRNMPTVHIAYHSYEHYSSVRNKHGPHSGLPRVKASTSDNDPPTVITPTFLTTKPARNASNIPTDPNLNSRLPDDVVPKAAFEAAPTPSADPDECESSPAAGPADDDAPADGVEKMVMGSTGVSNLRLVRRLLRKHCHDSGQVIETLVQWMAEDADNADPWWQEDGSAGYDGPQAAEAEKEHQAQENADEKESKAPSEVKTKPKHAKGAARQKKAESKKRQKEMAKMKKRKAAREAAANEQQPASANSHDGDGEADLSKSLDHIYI
ncbi:2-oxoglutarate dehydrogenase E1 component, partial [Dipsacomyces acuminosporus]